MRQLLRFRRLIFLGMGLIFCLALYMLVNLTSPTPASIGLFIFLLFIASFYIFRSLFNSNPRALIYASGLTLIFFLRVLELKHWLYIALVVALAVALDIYFRRD